MAATWLTFTIIEEVPEKSLVIGLKQPKTLDKDQISEALGFDKSWVTVIQNTP